MRGERRKEVNVWSNGAAKAKTYLWSSEFLALVSCPRVPQKWRRIFAITTDLYARAGEVNALQWEDVDLGVVLIHAREVR